MAGSEWPLPEFTDGVEIRVYDPDRRPQNWAALILPTQFAVFLQDTDSSAPLSRDGNPCGPGQTTCVLFDSLDAARYFCEKTVAALPNVCCEIFDANGRAKPPLLTVRHSGGDTHSWWARNSKYIALLLIGGSLPLLWMDWRNEGVLILPTLVGINMIVAGLRILHWRAGIRQAEEERRERLEPYSIREGRDDRF